MSAHPPSGGRIPAAVLGATGLVGQRFVSLLADHPWFELRALTASGGRVGRPYGDEVDWVLDRELPPEAADLELAPSEPDLGCPLVLSALDSQVAGPIETAFARAGRLVVTNAASHRLDADVPLLVPEVNPEHLALAGRQAGPGAIVAQPNCTTTGLVLALAPLARRFGVEAAHVVSLQALSGAGLSGLADESLRDTVVPWIAGEEEKLEAESRKILGALGEGGVAPADLVVAARCNRVPVRDGHTLCVSVRLGRPADEAGIVAAWTDFAGAPQELGLPSAPVPPILHRADAAPQPRDPVVRGVGMAIEVGRLGPCALLDWSFVTVSHNAVRGAAGGALLTAELAVARGLLDAAGYRRPPAG